jgi:hypothetical protein
MPKPAGWTLAGGRALPNLLFVTCIDALKGKIGTVAAADIRASLTAAGQTVLTLTTAQAASATNAIAAVVPAITPNIQGIVLLGGHDVVPLQLIDTLSPSLQPLVSRGVDEDAFMVWSDDAYGNSAGGMYPDLPVTRIPDAQSATFMWTCLAAPAVAPAVGYGIRNVARPFADGVYASGVAHPTLPMLTTDPTVSGVPPTYTLAGQNVYIMMHGSDVDATHFWGEDGAGGYPIGVAITDAPSVAGNIALIGCCWGAMIVTPKASAVAGAAVTSRGVADSIAMTFLERGARAFMGCTGTHYSPTVPPYQYYGGPLHAAFWARLAAGSAPAKALFEAKYLDYAPAIPHAGSTAASDKAIEQKIMCQFTTLGLGW